MTAFAENWFPAALGLVNKYTSPAMHTTATSQPMTATPSAVEFIFCALVVSSFWPPGLLLIGFRITGPVSFAWISPVVVLTYSVNLPGKKN